MFGILIFFLISQLSLSFSLGEVTVPKNIYYKKYMTDTQNSSISNPKNDDIFKK